MKNPLLRGLKHSRRDAPIYLGRALYSAVRGRFGMAGRLIVLAVAALTLSGCATTRYAPTYCVSKAQLEQLQKAKPSKVRDQLTGQADKDLKLVAGRLVRVEAWGDGLLDVLGGCTDPTKP